MRTVAIIDDDRSERTVLKGMAEMSGFTVIAEGSNGAEAIEVCRTKRPDVVIMDVKMPVMDGIDAATEISRVCPTPIVLLTASSDVDTLRRAADAGVMAYLTKPVRHEDLAPALEIALSRFHEFEALLKENRDLKNTLQARKSIEKAKGLLMDKEGITESEAFARIRRISMDKRKSMADIAEVIILALEDKKAGG